MRRALARAAAIALAALAIGAPSPAASDPAGNELATWAMIQTAITAGTLVQSGTCSASSSAIPSRAAAVACFNNSGSCATGGNATNYRMVWQDYTSCRVVTSTLTALTDAWLVNGATSWPVNGTGAFAADSSGLAGEPVGAQAFASPAGSSTTTYIQQAIVPSTLTIGTKVVARAYMRITSGSITAIDHSGDGSGCPSNTGGTVTGTATIGVYNSGGTAMTAPQSASSSTFSQIATLSFTVATAGTYYVRATMTSSSLTDTFYTFTSSCVAHTTTVTGRGFVTGLSVANT